MKKLVASTKNKKFLKIVLLSALLGTVSTSSANGFFGNNNNGFNHFFGGNNNNCNDWPIWTPMYWMTEMTGNSMTNSFGGNNRFRNNNCHSGYYRGVYNPYQTSYGANPYLGSPYDQQAYVYRAPIYNTYNRFPPSGYGATSGFSPFSGSGFNGFPRFGGSRSPFLSFGSGSPFNRIGFPMGMGGFSAPMSPMSPMSMGTMGMPAMNPMSGFGGSPFGGSSSFMPFR